MAASQMGGGDFTTEIKSKFDAEFRRFSINRSQFETFESFRELLEEVHQLKGGHSSSNKSEHNGGGGGVSYPFHISYIDPKDNDLLPINNTVNYLRALQTAKPLLRLVIQRQGELEDSYYVGRRLGASTSGFTSMLGGHGSAGGSGKPLISISKPSEFRQVRKNFHEGLTEKYWQTRNCIKKSQN